jgi:hypothetical protein
MRVVLTKENGDFIKAGRYLERDESLLFFGLE